jgi:hypothetical protein
MKERAETLIRSFGMSGYLITSELAEVEKQFGVKFGHLTGEVLDKETDYYPQFEKEVRVEASEMAMHFEVFYCLEKSIRKLITETMEDAAGPKWWASGRINPTICTEIQSRIQKEIDSGVSRRSLEELDYSTFGELSVIITANWDIFNAIFNSRKAVERVMNNLNTLRNPIAHRAKLSEDEALRLRLTVRDWFRMMQ